MISRILKQSDSKRLQEFWDKRYSKFSLVESGWRNLDEQTNSYLYELKTTSLKKALSALGHGRTSHFRILDMGCGQGFFANFYRRNYPNAHYTGIDICSKLIAHLRQHYPNYRFETVDLAQLRSCALGKFDIVQSFEVLHLVLNDKILESILSESSRLLEPTGAMLITAVLPGSTIAVNNYIRYRSRRFWQSLLAQSGLKIACEQRMYYLLPDGWPNFRLAHRLIAALPRRVTIVLDQTARLLRVPAMGVGGLDSKMKLLTLRLQFAGPDSRRKNEELG